MIKQGLELKQQQKLSPLQIQTIKLIELPIQELEQRIRTELEENPVLDDTPDPEKPEETKDVPLFSVYIFVIADFDIGIVHFFTGAVKFNHQETQKHKHRL